MATRNTDVADAQASRKLANGNLVSGKDGHLLATYTTTGAEAAGDLVKIGTLPKGVRPFFELMRVSAEAVGGTTATVATIGTLADDDAYSATAIGITTAINSAVTPIAGLSAAAVPLAAETTIYAKLGLASGSYTSGKKVFFSLPYILG